MAKVHIISKQDITNHFALGVPHHVPPLADGSVRACPRQLSVTLNSCTYARLGTLLQWWEAYPVPPTLPAPYNDTGKWGIVPSWGYGEVLQSRNPDIPKGTLLYGFWPTSSLPVDLELQPTHADGHFAETSPHRQALLPMYNQYDRVTDTRSPSEELQVSNANILAVWAAGYFLAKYSFPPCASRRRAIHPLGEGRDWTERDADLSSTLVVNLAASSKTARGFSWALSHRDCSTNSPLAVLEVTSCSAALQPTTTTNKRPAYKTMTVNYDELSSEMTINWITKLRSKRIMVADFGAPCGVMQRFHDTIHSSPSAAPSTLDYIGIGSTAGDSLKTADTRTRMLRLETSALMMPCLSRSWSPCSRIEEAASTSEG
ncbi:hypothetical protein ACRE_091000 [Hapsidospora chrysogenum ATCC 11550]|uniref:Uncharacterized protein n=1 Tax=Hapsidospora chrysogenum (strain ATCC 11550 / CBS 779.69 / DSM 880 / IAM 14645 / JCM 23072 / IMI 49137) TaxID=857340 RepID=A0A086ST08_HAPC1|nr:hypothetical protein ACRE_091000 [Hapsidospora chrysogenum ATCC 11550]